MKAISVVIPVYNSSEMLAELFAGIRTALQGESFEVIFVDDGSKDNSWLTLEKLKKENGDAITAVKLARNFGQHNALVCGFGFAQGEIIITMDDDLQHPPSELPKLLAAFRETDPDVLYGLPNKSQKGAVRTAGSYFVRRSSRYTAGNTGEGSSFRVMKKRIANAISEHSHRTMLFIDEILHWYTHNIHTIEVAHHQRKSGNSGYSLWRLWRLYVDISINHSAFPLKAMTWVGVLSSIVMFLLGVVFIYRKLVHDVPIGFTAQIVTILFSASIIMMSMGILGQYVFKLFQLQSKRPSYQIDRKI
jgi:undecaprenyl-phosphate 4-deoxy-4-formamido-L-arabinose transferase